MKTKHIFISSIIILLLIFSCNTKINKTKNYKTHKTDSTKISLIDDYAKFISGIKCKTFSDIQQKNFYKNYAKSIETTWNYFFINQILRINSWCKKNKITIKTDTNTAFYPFSGPDFSFLYAFYPYAKKYLLIGLENIGDIPKFKNYTPLEIEKYTNSLSDALTEFFHKGYFSTENMKNNFRNPNVNGIVHPLLFFITRTNHKITDLKYFVIDNCGQEKDIKHFSPLEKRIKGVKISFTGKYGKKTLYYIQVDLSNRNFPLHPEVMTFLSNFGEKNIFIKSASYLLQNPQFTYFRDFSIKQANKILQDDSGFKYSFLKKHNFNIKLFGSYSHTLNIFEKYWQPDLKAAFDKQKTGKLPFRFGYNIPFEETAVIYAQKKHTQKINYPIYKIQFLISWNRLEIDSFPKKLQPVDYYFDEGYYKYLSGNFKKLENAKKYLKKIKKLGYQDAFILKINSNNKSPIK
jgi:hypothetical protein